MMEDKEEYFSNMIQIHDKIKEHPFRRIFNDKTLEGTWKASFNEYLNCIKELADNFSSYCYVEKYELPSWWYHDLNGFIGRIREIFTDNFYQDKHKFIIVKGLNITYEEFLAKTKVNDINEVMIFFDGLIGDIHRFIEFKDIDELAGIGEQRSTEPHNGYYYRHMVRYTKKIFDNGEVGWYIKNAEEIEIPIVKWKNK